jgi:hypothetical protein
LQTIDPRNLPTSFTITQARAADLGEHPRLLDGFLYVGLTVLFSEPGLGKSMMAQAVEEHLAFGRPFGVWDPERHHRCLVLDFEGDMRLAAERSLTNTPWGLLASDHGHPMAADIEYETEWPGDGFFGRLGALEQRLEMAAQQGHPYSYVRIDTLRMFLGAKPHGVNAYEWDAACLQRLNHMAIRQNVALVLIHHTNKAGEVSGSTGVAGSSVVVAQLKRNPDNDDECLLVSHKVRVDAPFRYAVMMDDRGRWEFTEDITPTQAALSGIKRSVVNLITARGPRTMADIRDALPECNPHALKTAVRRLRDEYVLVYRHGMWQFTQQTIAEHPKCLACGDPMEVYERGQRLHPTCEPSEAERATVEKWLGPQAAAVIPAPAPAPAVAVMEEPRQHPADEPDEEPEPDEPDEHPETQKWPALRELQAAIAKSRMKPLPRVPKDERESKPWSLITERLDGHFRTKSWTGELPDDCEYVAIFDRNGSYMSACSSVPVAPNKLTHTGPLSQDERRERAGVVCILKPRWDRTDIPHPFGRAVEGVETGEPAWVTTSALETWDQRVAKGLPDFEPVTVVDSFTGIRNTSLFEPYYLWSRMVRETTSGEERVEAKRAMSSALRLLHPRKARSPFWRPDWHKAILAQAAIRHWVKAYQAVEQGAVLLSIGAVDEVAFAVPAGEDPTLWVPPGYRMGQGYGEVKHKEAIVQGEEIPSPLTREQWLNRGGKRRGK